VNDTEISDPSLEAQRTDRLLPKSVKSITEELDPTITLHKVEKPDPALAYALTEIALPRCTC